MDYTVFFKKLEKMLETMSPEEVMAALSDEERVEVSKMIIDMKLNKIISSHLS